MAEILTLPQMRAYSAQHLIEGADYWQLTAEQWLYIYSQVHNQVRSLDSEGQFYNAQLERIAADHDIVKQNAEKLQNAAQIARTEAGTLESMARGVGHLADEATERGFHVWPDNYETWPPKSGNLAQFKIDSEQADAYTEQLRFKVGNFMDHEERTAQNLIRAMGNGVCDDPNYQRDVERKLWGSILIGAALGGLAGGIPGALTGGAMAGIGDLLHETQGDGPKCK